MKIQEARKLFEAYKAVSPGSRVDRLEKIIERAEQERLSYDKEKNKDKMMILPIELLVEELIKTQYGLSNVKSVVSYDPLYAELSKYGLSLTKACNAAGVTPAARTAIGLSLPIHLEYLMKLATLLECDANKLFYVVDISEYRRRTSKKHHIENLTKQYADLVDDLIDSPSDSYLESMSDNNSQLAEIFTFGRGGLSFGPEGLTIEKAEKMLKIFDDENNN